jgi:branched-subunit amino acid aminotransferase/4-amino-4-deoxychorismate lyase
MSEERIYRWHEQSLVPLDYCDMAETSIEVVDSWLVTAGKALALGLHRERFLGSMHAATRQSTAADAFWDASIALLPRDGDWFPRVELQLRTGVPLLVLRIRSAPERTNKVVVTTWDGDPRTVPLIKGPDLAAMMRIRTAIQPAGAGEAVLLTREGYLVDGAYSGLLWWRGDILCAPPLEFDRVDSVTVRSVLALATALGVETYREAVTPAEIAGTELWSLNALHGIRIVTNWIDGPELAELPGRLSAWRTRLDALRKPI